MLTTLTLLAVGLIVVALAVSLISILVMLRRTLFTLGTINVGLRSIAWRVEPLDTILTDVNTELGRARSALLAVLKRHSEQRNGQPSHRSAEEMVR